MIEYGSLEHKYWLKLQAEEERAKAWDKMPDWKQVLIKTLCALLTFVAGFSTMGIGAIMFMEYPAVIVLTLASGLPSWWLFWRVIPYGERYYRAE